MGPESVHTKTNTVELEPTSYPVHHVDMLRGRSSEPDRDSLERPRAWSREERARTARIIVSNSGLHSATKMEKMKAGGKERRYIWLFFGVAQPKHFFGPEPKDDRSAMMEAPQTYWCQLT